MKRSRTKRKYSKSCKKSKKLRSRKRSRSRKDYGNIFGRRKEIPEKIEDISSSFYIKSPKGKRIKLSNAQYKRIQDWSKRELNKLRRNKK